MSAAGHSSTGAAKYQTTNATGSHAKTLTTKPPSGTAHGRGPRGTLTPTPAPAIRPAGRRAGRREPPVARQQAHPDEPHDQDVEHDERLPDVEMRPLEHLHSSTARDRRG